MCQLVINIVDSDIEFSYLVSTKPRPTSQENRTLIINEMIKV